MLSSDLSLFHMCPRSILYHHENVRNTVCRRKTPSPIHRVARDRGGTPRMMRVCSKVLLRSAAMRQVVWIRYFQCKDCVPAKSFTDAQELPSCSERKSNLFTICFDTGGDARHDFNPIVLAILGATHFTWNEPPFSWRFAFPCLGLGKLQYI